MPTKVLATINDLYSVSGKAEIVDGELLVMSPTGSGPGFAGDEIYASLRQYVHKTKTGRAVGDNKAFLVNLPNRQSFSPDAAYYTGPTSGMKFYPKPPIFAAEVRSEGDFGIKGEKAIQKKRADYFLAGTQVVWDVDLLSPDVVKVYRSGESESATIYRRGEIAEAEPAVPGWTMAVDDLFGL